SETSAELSGALGIALLGSAGMLLYRTWLDPALPAGLDEDAATRVRATLGGAVTLAERLPDPTGAAVTEAARTAFTAAMRSIALFGVAAMLLACGLVAHLMREGTGKGVAPAGPAADPD